MKKNVFTIGAFLLCVVSFSQEKDGKLVEGNKLYEDKAYFESIAVYEKVANRGYKSIELFGKLGDAYFFNAEYTIANKWYTKLFELVGVVDPIYYYRYSQTLKSVGDIKKSDDYLVRFSKLKSTDTRALEYGGNESYLAEIERNSGRYKIENLDINTPFSDYGASLYQERLVVFTSSRVPEKGKIEKDKWTSGYFTSLYSASILNEGILRNVQLFAEEIQTKYHESNPVFTKDGKVVFFTRNSGDVKNKNILLLKIYKATFENGKWGNITELSFNSDKYSCAHPALSPDEKTLYFVSDMTGGYGDSDLYKIAVDTGANVYGIPVNLGKNINTEGKETFPWVSKNNELYFASDGHLGLGGLDVFVTTIEKGDFDSKVINIGKPVNSSFDDFCFVQLAESKIGFFTSNRDGGKGKDDIYSFVEEIPLKRATQLVCTLVDNDTQKPIVDAEVRISDMNGNLIEVVKSDVNGVFNFAGNAKGIAHHVEISAAGYDLQERVINGGENNLNNLNFQLSLAKVIKPLVKGDDIAKVLNVKEILFDIGKSKIRSDMEVELQKILVVLEQNPKIKIAISSHTDSRGSAAANKLLSGKRAKSTRAWFIGKGINASRLSAKGYGEERLLNKCADGVKCTDKEHQLNRRSEFIIVRL